MLATMKLTASVAFSKAVTARPWPMLRRPGRLLTHAHPSLKNIEAAASGYDQQQQNPANPPAGQKQGGAVEQKEESAKFDPRSIGARQARDDVRRPFRAAWEILAVQTPPR
jgi:hypothetical protein